MFDDILNAFRAHNESGRAHTKKQPGIQLNSWVGSLDWIFNLIGCARTQNLSEESAQKTFLGIARLNAKSHGIRDAKQYADGRNASGEASRPRKMNICCSVNHLACRKKIYTYIVWRVFMRVFIGYAVCLRCVFAYNVLRLHDNALELFYVMFRC